MVNRLRIRRIYLDCRDRRIQILDGIGTACWHVVVLLLVQGFAGDNLFRYNWFWIGAFCSLAAEYAYRIKDGKARRRRWNLRRRRGIGRKKKRQANELNGSLEPLDLEAFRTQGISKIPLVLNSNNDPSPLIV